MWVAELDVVQDVIARRKHCEIMTLTRYNPQILRTELSASHIKKTKWHLL